MNHKLADYEAIVGPVSIQQLRQLGNRLRGMKVLHINSTKEGGGVAEILHWMVPLMHDIGIDASWQVITGPRRFYETTKSIHNGLQGLSIEIGDKNWSAYQDVSRAFAEKYKSLLQDADIIIVHDPQPAPLIECCPGGCHAKWIWRAHIDISHPFRPVWKKLEPIVQQYDASIFSLNAFAQPLRHSQFLVPPSIDPLSDKNCDLPEAELEKVRSQFGLDSQRPLLVQISRFDRFKDPIGVIKAYRLVKKTSPVQLVLAGGGASDDPEGSAIYQEVMEAAVGDPDLHVKLLPADAHRIINALQRLADIVIQKSTREGFGLTVTEAMWKGKPVIGGDTGGIRLQVFDHHTGFLVNTPEGAAHRIRFLLDHPRRLERMGQKAREFVRENFLLTRHLREYLTLVFALSRAGSERVIYI